jgi:Ser/Thr protein kinase RdoA (MazF antagonist)
MLEGLRLGLDFEWDKVVRFYKACTRSEIIHEDIHHRNIMKDDSGNFKLIDLDRISLA